MTSDGWALMDRKGYQRSQRGKRRARGQLAVRHPTRATAPVGLAPTPLRAAPSGLAAHVMERMQGFGSRGEGPSMAQAMKWVAPATILGVAAVAVAAINSCGGKGTSQ